MDDLMRMQLCRVKIAIVLDILLAIKLFKHLSRVVDVYVCIYMYTELIDFWNM